MCNAEEKSGKDRRCVLSIPQLSKLRRGEPDDSKYGALLHVRVMEQRLAETAPGVATHLVVQMGAGAPGPDGVQRLAAVRQRPPRLRLRDPRRCGAGGQRLTLDEAVQALELAVGVRTGG